MCEFLSGTINSEREIVIVQRFGLNAQECSRRVAHSRNLMVLAKSMFIF